MKKKIPSRILAFLLMALSVMTLFTGCVRSGVGIVVNPDDTGDVELSYGISKETYQMILDQYDADLYEGEETYEIVDGDTTYICVSEHKPFGNLDELKQILLDLEYTSEDTESLFSAGEEEQYFDFEEYESEYTDICDCEECEEYMAYDHSDDLVVAEDYDESQDTDAHIFKSVEIEKNKDFFETTYHMTLVTNAFPASPDELSLYGFDTDNFYKVLISVTLPGEIKAEGATVQENTASFKLTAMEEEKTLTVNSSSVDTIRIVALVVAVVVVILLIALLTRGNKKKTNTKSF